MDENIVLNANVKQKDPSRAVVIAVTSDSIFDLEGEQGADSRSPANESEPLQKGVAFPFIEAVQRVNEKLVEINPEETLLFDVMLLSKNGSPESRSRIENSTVHHGLDIGRFCFCEEEDFTEPLRSNNVKMFLSKGADDVRRALEKGVPASLLYQHGVPESSDPLRVLLIGDVLGLSDDTAPLLAEQGFSEAELQNMAAAKGAMKEFVQSVGEMRGRFGREDSPLCTCLMTVWSCRDVCASALKTLRAWGLEVDEAYCLAGAPRSPILAHMRPHVLYDHQLQGPHHVPAQC
ncbi:hypothetical protein AGOR_G00000750 [Albula goreensis]|uniref:Cytosolic 5'-nucleotidase 1A-like n=1 Tax=Albula goreensis TaxID=1534307 RepID=A0A8T3E8D0_9TELE|nr:hypothetical protein AGOR_G00000750 [Albula goreensis]